MALGAITSIGYGLTKFFDAYREQERAIQKVEQAIKTTAGAAGLSLKQLTKEASILQNTTLFGDEEILNKSTAQLLTFVNITGDTFLKAQRAALDLSTVLDGDLQNASMMLGKAFNDPISGLTALRRVGVSFTEQQREQIKVLTQTNRIEEAQAIILAELTRQYGGQAEAAAKGAGVWKQVSIQFGEIAETLGGKIASITTGIATQWRDTFKSIAESLASSGINESFSKQVDIVADLTTVINPLLERYDQLKLKSKLSKEEQTELNSIIKQVSETIPGAVSAFDSYGIAIGINTIKAREFINEQVAMMAILNKDAIKQSQKALEDLKIPLQDAKRGLDNIMKTGEVTIGSGGTTSTHKATQEEIKAVQDKYTSLLKEKLGYETYLKTLNGDALKDELARREEDAKASKEAEEKKLKYKKMTLTALKELADDEDEFAKAEIARRKNTKNENAVIEDKFEPWEKETQKIIDKKKEFTDKAQQDFEKENDKWAEEFLDKKFTKEVTALINNNTREVAILNEKFRNGEISEEEYGNEVARLKEKFANDSLLLAIDKAERELAILKLSGEDIVDAEKQLAELRLKEQEGQAPGQPEKPEKKKPGDIDAKDIANVAIDTAQNTADAIAAIKANARQAELDAELNAIDQLREKELSNKNLTEDEKDAINEKYRKKEASIKLAAWKKDQQAAVVQAMINGALAITKTFASLGFVLGMPAAIAQAVATGLQIAVIKAQKPPQFKSGGYTDDYYNDDKPAGTVHANEFVANAQAKRNPTVRPVLDIIDYAQRSGTIRSINLPAVIASNFGGFKTGGYTTSEKAGNNTADNIPDFENMINAMKSFEKSMDKLQREGISGKWVYQDFKTMADKETKAISKTN